MWSYGALLISGSGPPFINKTNFDSQKATKNGGINILAGYKLWNKLWRNPTLFSFNSNGGKVANLRADFFRDHLFFQGSQAISTLLGGSLKDSSDPLETKRPQFPVYPQSIWSMVIAILFYQKVITPCVCTNLSAKRGLLQGFRVH